MSTGRQSTITVFSEAWYNPITIQIASPIASDGVNDIGRFSCIIPDQAMLLIGYDSWMGRWIRWENESFGVWGGIVEAVNPRPDDRAWELSCVGFAILLDWRVTPMRYKKQSSPAGALVKRAYSDGNADYPTWIHSFLTDESGDPVSWEWRGDTVLETMRSLSDQTGEEWYVRYEEDTNAARTGTGIVARWARKINVDGFNMPLIHEGKHHASLGLPVSGADIVNDIRAIGNDQDLERAHRMRLTDVTSRALYGTRSETRRYIEATTKTALQWRGRKDLLASASPVEPVVLSLPITSYLAKRVTVGTIAMLWSPTADYTGLVRFTARAVDLDNGTITYAGSRY